MARVLILNANCVGIGTYHRAFNFGRALAAHDHDVVMMTVSPERMFARTEWRDESGLRVVECPRFLDEALPWHASGPLDITFRTATLLGTAYDLVYAFEYQPNVSLPVAVGRCFRKFRLVSDWCDWHAGAAYYFGGKRWAHAIDRVFEEWIRHKADHVTVINRVLYDRARSIGIPEERLTIVREGVDTERFKAYDQGEARDRLNLPRDSIIVGTIKDAAPGHEVLAEAVHLAARRLTNLRLMVVGHEPPRIRAACEDLGIEDRLILPGRVSDEDLPYYLASCDVLALPLEDTLANRGRWPHKLGDMVASARPVVTSPGGEFPELLGANECVRLVPFDADSFSEGILDVLNSPTAALDMAGRGRRFACDHLNWSEIGREVNRVVEAIA